MEEESERLHFERAAKIRDQIEHIEKVIEKQKIVSRDFLDQDVVGLHREGHQISFYVLFIRAGKVLGGKGFILSSIGLPDDEVLYSFLRQYYREGRFIPERILLPKAIPEQLLLEQWLAEEKGKKMHLLAPARGDKRELLEMAHENAEKFLFTERDKGKDEETALEVLRERLRLRRMPRRIEAFDISNLQGIHAVGSMVSFQNGKADKKRYRHFRIRTVEGADDYGMMYEVLLRRYQRALEEEDLPDLVLLDGGRGQLNVAQEVFKELGIKDVDLISLAKGRDAGEKDRSRSERTGEKVYHPQYKEPVALEKHSAVIHFLDQIRDEAHRFAITHHKKIRGKETIKSELGEIPGIGKVRQKELLRFFGSVEKIKEAAVGDLLEAPRMNEKIARIVYDFFHTERLKNNS